jgi:mRNA interferase MazF
MRRGEIWWVEFDERRPVVLLSEDEPSGFRAMQVVAPADTDFSGLGIDCPLKACCGSRSRGRALPRAPG